MRVFRALITSIVPLALLVVGWTSDASAQCSCNYFPDEGRWSDHCATCIDQRICNTTNHVGGCVTSVPIDLTKIIPDCDAAIKPTATAAMTRVGGPGGPFYAVGNQYSAAKVSISQGTANNYPHWGTGTFVFDVSAFGAVFTIDSHSDPGKRKLTVTNFSATVPSFVHGATSPGTTGENNFALMTNINNEGEVTVSSGEVRLVLHAFLTNDYYLASAPAHVNLELTGSINPGTQQLSLTVGGIVFE